MIVAYDYSKSGIYYTGPANDAAYITRFVDTMKHPVKLLNSKSDLLNVHQQYHVNIYFTTNSILCYDLQVHYYVTDSNIFNMVSLCIPMFNRMFW